MSLSYIGCEAEQGPGGNAYINSLWQQAAAKESRCSWLPETAEQPVATPSICPLPMVNTGIAANGLASTPYNVATGGTDFLDTYEGTVSIYWS